MFRQTGRHATQSEKMKESRQRCLEQERQRRLNRVKERAREVTDLVYLLILLNKNYNTFICSINRF